MTSGITFWRWSMYLQHILGVMVLQNFLMPSFNSGMFLGLCLSLRKIFIEPHTFSIGFKSGLSARLFHQLIRFFSKKGLNVPTGVFGVIILIQFVPIRVHLPKEWYEGGRQNVSIPCCCHDPSKHDELRGTSLRNSCPHMNLWGMLMSVFELLWSIHFRKDFLLWHSNWTVHSSVNKGGRYSFFSIPTN